MFFFVDRERGCGWLYLKEPIWERIGQLFEDVRRIDGLVKDGRHVVGIFDVDYYAGSALVQRVRGHQSQFVLRNAKTSQTVVVEVVVLVVVVMVLVNVGEMNNEEKKQKKTQKKRDRDRDKNRVQRRRVSHAGSYRVAEK